MLEPFYTVWIYPTLGEPISVNTRDFASEAEVIEAVNRSFASGAPFQVREYDRDHDTASTTLTVNPANIVAIRVWTPETSLTSTGQYL